MIGALVAYLSMDIAYKLIAAGVVAFSANVLSASNTTPIVVTIDKDIPKAWLKQPFHGTLDQATGNAGANGIWEFSATDARTLTLRRWTPQGALVDSVGNGPWVSGGRVQVALPAGRVLLGRRHCNENAAPPRIVFVPFGAVKFDFDAYGGIIPKSPIPNALGAETSEQQSMLLARQVSTERQRFEIHVWGATKPPDPDFGDFDATQALYNQVVRSIFDLCPAMDIIGGQWRSQGPNEGQLSTRGHEYVLMASIDQPVTDTQLLFVPGGTPGIITVNFEGGQPSDDQIIQVTP